jgi:hypothetical protein
METKAEIVARQFPAIIAELGSELEMTDKSAEVGYPYLEWPLSATITLSLIEVRGNNASTIGFSIWRAARSGDSGARLRLFDLDTDTGEIIDAIRQAMALKDSDYDTMKAHFAEALQHDFDKKYAANPDRWCF